MSFTYGSNSRPYDFNVGSLTKDYNQIGLEQYEKITEPNKPRYYSVTFEKELPEELYKSLELIPITKLQELASKEYENEFYDIIKVQVDPKFMNVELQEFVTAEDGELELADYEKLTINRFIESVKSGVLIPKGSMVEVENKEIEKMENVNDMDILEPEMVDAELSDSQQNMNLWNNDSWYEMHPDKVLGEIYTASSKYGEVIKVRGTIDALSRIEVPENWGQLGLNNNNPLLSVDNQIPNSVIENETNSELITNVIKQSKKDVVEKVKRVRKKQMQVETDSVETEEQNIEVQTFEETWKNYNEGISADDLECHVWYKSKIGAPLSKMWVNLIRPTYPESEDLKESVEYNVSEEKVREWIENGVAFWFNRQVLPAYLYLSGDVYEKKRALQQDKEYIIQNFGEAVFEQQETAISTAFSKKQESRLILRGNNEEGLTLVPFSDIAKNFEVSRLNSFKDENDRFVVYQGYAKGVPFINWEKTIGISSYGRNVARREVLSLKDAFCYYLIKFKPPLKKQGITHYEILKIYVNQGSASSGAKGNSPEEVEKKKAQALKKKQIANLEGKRLFAKFLYDELDEIQRIELETIWNSTYNNYLFVDSKKVPVAFTWTKYVRGQLEILRPEKREAVAFMMNNGSGVLSYDVGVGKTPSAIFSISSFIDSGYSKRPLIVVPNQVYKQFINEIKSFAPHLKINGLYNLGGGYLSQYIDENGRIIKQPEVGSVSIMTYEAFEKLGFKEDTINRLYKNFYEILNQGGEDERSETEKQKVTLEQRLLKLMGKGLEGSILPIEDLGFDFICYDEAHKGKKVFSVVKGEVDEDGEGNTDEYDEGKKGKKTKTSKNPYVINSGSPSAIGLKMFMMNQYILRTNGEKNIMLLTATPFTNSPLEIFSVLSSVAYNTLQNSDLSNLKKFFDNYVDVTYELVITSTLKANVKQVIKGFRNLTSLQSIVRRYILYKTGEDVGVPRPSKVVLPLTKKKINNEVIDLPDSEKIETFIKMSPIQEELMSMVIGYVETGEPNIPMDCEPIWKRKGISTEPKEFSEEESAEGRDALERAKEGLSDDAFDDEIKRSVRILRGMSFGRAIAISPYLFACLPLNEMPTPKQFVENSPKIKYALDCIKSVKEHHEKMGTPMSGQVIYSDRGVELFGLIKDYLIDEIGFAKNEIGIIKSGMGDYYNTKGKVNKNSKEYIKNLFNGEIYNEETQLFEPIDDSERIKVIIGSSTIKEGINLQKYSTCLYNLNVDWNPTDVQQLEGRIWRQGNTFSSVRIVTPLLIDSTDAFIFQKLEEKTARINSIWEIEGKNSVLKIEDIDPQALKKALIRNPEVITTYRIEEILEKLKDDLLIYEGLQGKLRSIIQNISVVNKNIDILLPVLRYFYPKTFSLENLPTDKLELAQKIINAISKMEQSISNNGYIVNDEGQAIFDDNGYQLRNWKGDIEEKRIKEWEKKNPEQVKKNAKLRSWDDEYVDPKYKPVTEGDEYFIWDNISSDFLDFVTKTNPNFDYDSPFYRYSFNNTMNSGFARYRRDLGTANKELKKDKNDVLNTLDITLNFEDISSIEAKRDDVNETLANLKREELNVQLDEYRAQMIEGILIEIEENFIPPKPLYEVVADFSKLNYLLDDKKIDKKESKQAEVIKIESVITNTTENVESAKRMIDSVGKAVESVETTPESEEMSLSDLQNLLDGYKDTIEFLSGQDKKDMKILIEALTETIEFLKLA